MNLKIGWTKNLRKDIGVPIQLQLPKAGLIEVFKEDASLETLNGVLLSHLKNLKKKYSMSGLMPL